MFQHIEPFPGWHGYYDPTTDPQSPHYGVEHSLFAYDRHIYTFDANPLWDTIGSENLLVKILFADYEYGYAIIELLGEWNDLHENDFRLLKRHLLEPLLAHGIQKFILICENVFNGYFDADDYYEELHEELEDGWAVLLRARPGVRSEMERYGLGGYFFWSDALDAINWRKLKPWLLYEAAEASMTKLLR